MGAGRAGAGLIPSRLLVAPAALVAAGLSSWAALTDPFTAGADAVTAVAIALGAALAAWRWRVPAPAPAPPTAPPPTRRFWPWAVLGAVILAVELSAYFLSPRVDYPTLSSLYDAATRSREVKGLFFFLWLALGAALSRR